MSGRALSNRGERKRQKEGCPLARLRLGPNATPMGLDDSLADGESETGTGQFVAVKACKGFKNLLTILWIEPDPVVSNAYITRRSIRGWGDPNSWWLDASILDGIPDKQLKHLYELALAAPIRAPAQIV